MNANENGPAFSCPYPISNYPHVLLAHGGGGRLMQQLIEKMFYEIFGKPVEAHDAAVFPAPAGRLAFTTDSFVVRPLFFPGGDIGELAVYGTVNDLAMAGARPLVLSLAFILEEGLPMATLERVCRSVKAAVDIAGVKIVTGDTKVVDRGKGDGIFINTSGIGVIAHDLVIAPSRIKPGDAVVISGDVGRHGMAIMAVREGLAFDSRIESDTLPLAASVDALIKAGLEVHCLRDMTRGGLASTFNELAASAGVTIELEETSITVRPDVAAACELLGLDPLYVANEGRFAVFLPQDQAARAADILKGRPQGEGAAVVGKVLPAGDLPVVLKTVLGSRRVLDMLSGEQLPRIC